MGRRFEKKVTVGGTTGFHARYLYRAYLQVAECDLTGETPALVRSYLWDPSEPQATRVPVSYTHLDVYKRQDYFRNVNNTYDPAGNLVSSYSAAEGLMRTRTGADGELVLEWRCV